MPTPPTSIKGKGAALNMSISSVLTPVAGVISIDGPEQKSEEYDADWLGNTSAGRPYKTTGVSEGGSASAECWFVGASLAAVLALIATPAASAWSISLSDASAFTFAGAGVSLAGPKVTLKEGVKATIKIKLDGLMAGS